ncbi:hypothetical protein RI367_004729 [Sorochytrium milnesiophthora]
MTSKYEGLPDIDTQPDVYESHDAGVADNDNTADNYTLDAADATHASEDIVSDRLTPREASAKFANAVVDASGADFSGSLAGSRRAYRTRTKLPGDFTATTDDYQVETPIQRLKRLQAESRQLMEDLAAAEYGDAKPVQGFSSAEVLAQLEQLQRDLEGMNGTAAASASAMVKDVQMSKVLMDHLKAFRETSATGAGPHSPPPPQDTRNSATSNMVTYELYYSPETSTLVRSTKLADMDQRLSSIEKLLGNRIDTDAVPNVPLMQLINRLDQHVSALVQPRQLDLLARRVKTVLADLERTAELKKRAAESATKKRHNIAAIYSVTEKIDPLINIAPALLHRLQSLQTLHNEANLFSANLKRVVDDQAKMSMDLQQTADILRNLEQSIQVNGATIQKNVERIEERLAKVVQQTERL